MPLPRIWFVWIYKATFIFRNLNKTQHLWDQQSQSCAGWAGRIHCFWLWKNVCGGETKCFRLPAVPWWVQSQVRSPLDWYLPKFCSHLLMMSVPSRLHYGKLREKKDGRITPSLKTNGVMGGFFSLKMISWFLFLTHLIKIVIVIRTECQLPAGTNRNNYLLKTPLTLWLCTNVCLSLVCLTNAYSDWYWLYISALLLLFIWQLLAILLLVYLSVVPLLFFQKHHFHRVPGSSI